jgi:amino acid transporter
MTEGVAGLLRDKTRPGRLAPLGAQTEERVVRATLSGNMLFYNYMLMYAAAIRLRYSKPALARPFKVPGGTVGFAGVLFSFLVAFFPPDQLPVGSPSLYVGIVAGGTVIFCSIPLVLHAMRQADWTEAKQPAE